MKHDELRSVAHNIADSLASGCGLMIGVYMLDVFGEAARNPRGVVEVDFLNGSAIGGEVSAKLDHAIRLYSEALPALCERHRVNVKDFSELTVRYFADPGSPNFTVTVTDQLGRRSVTEYGGIPGRRLKHIDQLGRIRSNAVIRSR